MSRSFDIDPKTTEGSPRPEPDIRRVLLVVRAACCLPLAFLVAGDVRTADAALSLALVCGGFAAASLAYATFRETVLVRRTVARLRDPKRRAVTVEQLRQRVSLAAASGDIGRLEDTLREVLEPLLVVGLWDEVAEFAEHASPHHRALFARWLAGVHALAELHRGDTERARSLLEGAEVTGEWLGAIDALRLALTGDGEAALERLGDEPRKLSFAIKHQRQLARAHALAGVGRRDEAREVLRAMERQGLVEAALAPEGPATPLAAQLVGPNGGPFRAPG
ncbi:MAG: hypothetical protein CMN30_15430 [Sandaracinus sp.]|nr:hypothetical protein [Sandaracinus sp.]